MRVRPWIVAAMCAAGSVCASAHAEVVPLATLEKQALERHALLRGGAARERAAAAEVRLAQSAYKPRIGMNVDSNVAPGRQLVEIGVNGEKFLVQGVNVLDPQTKNPNSDVNPFLPQWRSGVDLTVGANLYDFGRTQSAVAASRAKLTATRADQKLTRSEIVARVRGAYLGWLNASELERMAATASSDAAQRRDRVSQLVTEGVRARNELAPVDADRLLAELELERAQGQLATARLMLQHAVGRELPESAEPDVQVLKVTLPEEPSAEPDPALQMLTQQQNALRAQARSQRMQRAPVLSFLAGAGLRHQYGKVVKPGTDMDASDGVPATLNAEAQHKFLPSYAVGLAMAIPLWDGGGASASADATEARADELRIQLESAERERKQERERARLDAEHAEKRAATAQQLLEVCKTRVADTEAGYELGAMQFEHVQQARALLRRAETEIVLARVARAEAILRVAPVTP